MISNPTQSSAGGVWEFQSISAPQLMLAVAPVMVRALSEAAKAATLPTSSSAPQRDVDAASSSRDDQ
jgi:hypothetical protein